MIRSLLLLACLFVTLLACTEAQTSSYAFIIGPYSPCNTTCGTGVRTRSVSCVSYNPTLAVPTYVAASSVNTCLNQTSLTTLCVDVHNNPIDCSTVDASFTALTPPVSSKSCSRTSCVGHAYLISDYSTCSTACSVFTSQTRTVQCVSYNSSNPFSLSSVTLLSSTDFCSNSTSIVNNVCVSSTTGLVEPCASPIMYDFNGVPVTSNVCPYTACVAYAWVVRAFAACPNLCGTATVTRSVFCASYDPTVATGGVLTVLPDQSSCVGAPLVSNVVGGTTVYAISAICLDGNNNQIPCTSDYQVTPLVAGVSPATTMQCMFGVCCHWTQTPFTSCPKCGPGAQTSIATCVDPTGVAQPDSCCTSQALTTPTTQKTCVNQPACVTGDPEFVGFLGQKYEVHGVPNAIFNVITSPWLQYNAMFVYLPQATTWQRQCDRQRTHPWTHAGTYLGLLGFKTGPAKILIEPGSCVDGIKSISVDNKKLSIGQSVQLLTIDSQPQSITLVDKYTVQLELAEVSIKLINSDLFFNQEVKLTAYGKAKKMTHGLLGQTWRSNSYVKKGMRRVYEGTTNDYMLQDEDIFGNDFVFNKFSN